MDNAIDKTETVIKFTNLTDRCIFLTGKAGTGKTTLLRKIIETTHKNTVVVAPTGIAALNAGGVTIHSMFQLAPGGFVPDLAFTPNADSGIKIDSITTLSKTFKMSGVKQAVIRAMDLLVIDEVSMLRADLLDAMDYVMRRVRRREQPFGGVQVLFIGDLLQLPPVVKNEEWNILQNYYKGIFFFHAHVIQKVVPIYIQLTKIYRQTDDRFINVLNNLRNNIILQEDIIVLEKHVKQDFSLDQYPGYIYLTTHNRKADEINQQSLDSLKEKVFNYHAEIGGDFPDKMYPMAETLVLKKGAQVMFTKNDLSTPKQFYNGKMGIIESLSKDEISVHFPEENYTILVERYEWSNVRFNVNENTKEIEEEVIGTFVHYPLKLAWAITIHKSQGLTFDKAILDVADVFQPGQAYVALSRLRSMDGLILVGMLTMKGIQNAEDVMYYAQNEADENALVQSLESGTKRFIYHYVRNSFDFTNLKHQWQNHASSYNDKTALSEKVKHKSWAKTHAEQINLVAETSSKFLSWLDGNFGAAETDYQAISNKVMGAYEHFFQRLDPVLDELLTKIEALKKVKRVKEYFNELAELEELTTNVILGMTKSKLLLEAFISGKEINKLTVSNEFIKTYKANKFDKIRTRLKETKKELIHDDEPEDFSYYVRKPKKVKEDKKSTYQITYELWLEKKSPSEIAIERKLTPTTIHGHLARLIEEEKVDINDVLSDDKIRALGKLFDECTDSGLAEIKERAGDEFSYGEIRMFKAAYGKD